jgi:hypothetical protein
VAMGNNFYGKSMSANYGILQNCRFKGVKLFGKWQKNCFFSAYWGGLAENLKYLL